MFPNNKRDYRVKNKNRRSNSGRNRSSAVRYKLSPKRVVTRIFARRLIDGKIFDKRVEYKGCELWYYIFWQRAMGKAAEFEDIELPVGEVEASVTYQKVNSRFGTKRPGLLEKNVRRSKKKALRRDGKKDIQLWLDSMDDSDTNDIAYNRALKKEEHCRKMMQIAENIVLGRYENSKNRMRFANHIAICSKCRIFFSFAESYRDENNDYDDSVRYYDYYDPYFNMPPKPCDPVWRAMWVDGEVNDPNGLDFEPSARWYDDLYEYDDEDTWHLGLFVENPLMSDVQYPEVIDDKYAEHSKHARRIHFTRKYAGR